MGIRTHVVLLSLLCAVGLTAGFAAWRPVERPTPGTDSGLTDKLGMPVGEDLALTDHNGRSVTHRDFAGKPRLVFFGFTHCPDVCPTGLSIMSLLLEDLGGRSKDVHALFITVDPERDTPAVLKDYLSNFAGEIVGLTGTREQVSVVAKSFHAYFKKVTQAGGGYLVDHTASIILLDRLGRFRSTVDIHEDRGAAFGKIRRLVEERT